MKYCGSLYGNKISKIPFQLYFNIHQETPSPPNKIYGVERRPVKEPGRPVAGVARGPEPSRDSDPTPSWLWFCGYWCRSVLPKYWVGGTFWNLHGIALFFWTKLFKDVFRVQCWWRRVCPVGGFRWKEANLRWDYHLVTGRPLLILGTILAQAILSLRQGLAGRGEDRIDHDLNQSHFSFSLQYLWR